MDPHLIRFPSVLWEQAKAKAGLIPMARIVRLLLEKWVKGEIDLTK